MQKLREIHLNLLSQIDKIYPRQIFKKFNLDSRLVGLVGARGVGKTSFLLKKIKDDYGTSRKALYASADNLYFAENTLFDLADQFIKEEDGKLLCLDEIHRYPNWNQELKNIYDSFPQLKVIFSGSSSIELIKGRYDLSRRALLNHLHGFSFREFLELKTNKKLSIYTLEELLKKHQQISDELSSIKKLLGLFKEYLRHGYYPSHLTFELEESFYQSLYSAFEKVIFEDLASSYNIESQNLIVFKKIIYFLSTSAPGTISVNKLSKSLSKDHSTISSYLQMLFQSSLLRFLLKDAKGHALVRNAEKIYLENSNLLYAINDHLARQVDLGTLRELFFINQIQSAGHSLEYSDYGDFCLLESYFEIGGKSKKRKQLKSVKNSYVVKDDILVSSGNNLPLYLFGFLY